MTTTFDVAIVGGSAAGSAAALQLGRIRRSVIVIDAAEPRNAPAAHMHGFPGFDGTAPKEFVQAAHRDLAPYGVAIEHDRVVGVEEAPGGDLVLECESGAEVRARRVLLATGLTDLLPDIEGVAEGWGDHVIHCPWCHGWEVRDQRIAVLDTVGMGAHQAQLFSQLSTQVTLVLGEGATLDDETRERLALAGVEVESSAPQRVERVDGVTQLALADGRVLEVDAAVVAAPFEANVGPFQGLVGIETHMSQLGTVVATDTSGRTTHPRIYAAGNVADPMLQVLHAAARGSHIAGWINGDLFDEDLERRRRSAAETEKWDSRFREVDQRFSGRANGSIEVELGDRTPARVLDVGCGEGADAIWLAGRGWTVTATDISPTAIERARFSAAASDVQVAFQVADATLDVPPTAAFDVVTMSYPALKLDIGLAALPRIADAVAIGGELLVIGHADVDREKALAHGFDPDAFLSLDGIVSVLPAGFEVVVDEIRDRPNPPEGTHHHRDRVLRAVRRA